MTEAIRTNVIGQVEFKLKGSCDFYHSFRTAWKQASNFSRYERTDLKQKNSRRIFRARENVYVSDTSLRTIHRRMMD